MPAFEFADFNIISYGKTGSTSLTTLAEETSVCDIIKKPTNHYWEPGIGVDWSELPDKPNYVLLRRPRDRVISGLYMFIVERYCNQMMITRNMENFTNLSKPFTDAFKTLWQSESFWQRQIPFIMDFWNAELLSEKCMPRRFIANPDKDVVPYIDRFAISHKELLTNWQDVFTQKLLEERYHLGNWIYYLPTEHITAYIKLDKLNDFLSDITSVSDINSNAKRKFTFGSDWSDTDIANIQSSITRAITRNPTWQIWEHYLEPENIAYADICTNLPEAQHG
tara:strand:+ start:1011 stop:1850 length:840 start_codon:yes stop_codon:yes gene_type:complete